MAGPLETTAAGDCAFSGGGAAARIDYQYDGADRPVRTIVATGDIARQTYTELEADGLTKRVVEAEGTPLQRTYAAFT